MRLLCWLGLHAWVTKPLPRDEHGHRFWYRYCGRCDYWPPVLD